MHRRALILACGSLLVRPAEAQAKQCLSVSMPDQLDVDGKQLLLNGLGLREATVLAIDVYVARLYLEQRSTSPKQIIEAESTKLMKLVLLRDVSYRDLAEQLGSHFRHAAGSNYDKLKTRFDKMAAWLPTLREGDTFSVTYRAASGLEVRHGKKTLGTIPGADYGRAIFSIWLGDKPPNEGLKRGLLGGRCG
jgi:hypothetical protein